MSPVLGSARSSAVAPEPSSIASNTTGPFEATKITNKHCFQLDQQLARRAGARPAGHQRAITAEIQHDPALAEELVARLLRPQMKAAANRLREAREAAQLAAGVDVDLAAELLFGPVLHRWLLRTAPLDDRFANDVVDRLLAGLAPRS
jgi:hypothetical protein